MNDLDIDALLGSEDDARRPRSRSGRGRRRRRNRKRGGFVAPMLALIIILGILGGGGYYAYLAINKALIPEDYTGAGTGEVVVEINPGDNATVIGEMLERQGVVKSARAFTNAADAAGKTGTLTPGHYTMRKGMSAANAVALLDPAKLLQSKITVREGLRLTDIIDQLAKKMNKPKAEFVAAAKDAEALGLPAYAKGRLEGYAFPATYDITPKSTPASVLAGMVERFDEAATKVDLVKGAKAVGLTPAQAVTVASIVQAEAGSAEDMPKIARVIYNRMALNPPKKLEMDSTTFYGLGEYGTHLTNAQLESKSKYNTYAYPGLPPGPIANPGEVALEAALNPAKGNWLYFVTTDLNKGITKFADNETDFLKLKAEFEKNQGN